MSRQRPPELWTGHPRVIGVDLARHGEDRNCIVVRQDKIIREIIKFPGKIENLMVMVGHIAMKIQEWKPQSVFIDVGMGYGVIDRLRELGFQNIIEVNFGMRATDEKRYSNKRAEIWGRMKDWLLQGGVLPKDEDLKRDLTAPQYAFDKRQRIQLEHKRDIKRRGLPSPDEADALATTFSVPISANIYDERSPAQELFDEVEGKTRLGYGWSKESRYIDFGG